MKQKLYQIDAFTDKVFSGNPAAVCPLEQWLSGSKSADNAGFISTERFKLNRPAYVLICALAVIAKKKSHFIYYFNVLFKNVTKFAARNNLLSG